MRYYQYFWRIFLKYKWVLLALVAVPVLVAVAFCKLSTPLYESTAEIYPLVMHKKVDMLPLNPCYSIRRICKSRQFRQLLIEEGGCPSLTLNNYDRRITIYETPRHTLTIAVRAESPAMADSVATRLLQQLNFAGKCLQDVYLTRDSNLCEMIPWDYYHHCDDFIQDSARYCNGDSSTYYLFDTLSLPMSAAEPVYPPNVLKISVLVFWISVFLSFFGVCLFDELRNRMKKNARQS